MRISYKVEIQPTKTQVRSLRQHAGNARWAYNWGLRKRMDAYEAWVEADRPGQWNWPNAISLHRELNVLKKLPVEEGGVPWMYEASKCAPQQALRDLDNAFKHFFRRLKTGEKPGYPRFKSRSRGIGGFRLDGSVAAFNHYITLPRIGRIRIKPGDHGYIPIGKCAQVSVREDAGRWYASIAGPEIPDAPPNGGPVGGLDMGVAQLATLSSDEVIPNLRISERHQSKIRKAQKSVSRKQKGSRNRGRARHRLARAHKEVRDQRKDYLHKVTTRLTKSHGSLVIEDLKVQKMTRKGGSRKRNLNRVMADASLGEFRRVLEYKGKLYGCSLIPVNPAYTSQRCSRCGHTERANRPSQAKFLCRACGHTENADLNAAKNILVAGSCLETLNACGDGVRPSRKARHLSKKQESAVASG